MWGRAAVAWRRGMSVEDVMPSVEDEPLTPKSRSEVFGQPRDPLKQVGRLTPSTSQGPPAGASVAIADSATAQGPPVGASVPVADSATAQGPPVGASVPVADAATAQAAACGSSAPVAVQQQEATSIVGRRKMPCVLRGKILWIPEAHGWAERKAKQNHIIRNQSPTVVGRCIVP